jgi:hypothetical protein
MKEQKAETFHSIVKNMGYSNETSQLMTVPPYAGEYLPG